MGKSVILVSSFPGVIPESVTVEPNPPLSSSNPELRWLTRICELLKSISDLKVGGTSYNIFIIILCNMFPYDVQMYLRNLLSCTILLYYVFIL